MTPIKYAKILMRDNEAHVEKTIGGKHVRFLAYRSAIVDCDIQINANLRNEKQFLLYYETKVFLVKQFEKFALENYIKKD
jgi:hypothetical protein